MASLSVPLENPRKQPVQQRSVATVDAILDATIQVLIRHGKDKLTTTLVAQRAGVSVGTLYQYFPNKRSVLQAALRRKITIVTEAVEAASIAAHGLPLRDVVAILANAYFQAKLRDPRTGLALYAVSSDGQSLRELNDLRQRNSDAVKQALANASDKLAVSVDSAAFMLQAAMTGTSRRLLETHVPTREHEAVREQMIAMLQAYVASVS